MRRLLTYVLLPVLERATTDWLGLSADVYEETRPRLLRSRRNGLAVPTGLLRDNSRDCWYVFYRRQFHRLIFLSCS